jgi:hypothetical protein
MRRPFSYWRSARNRGIDAMLRLVLCVFMLSGVTFGQVQPSAEKIRKDTISLQVAVNDVLGITVPGWGGGVSVARAAYLDGYGIVVTAEVALVQPRNPFSAIGTPEQIRTMVAQRRKDSVDKLKSLLKEKAPALESIGPAESVAIIVNLLNTNPADVPDFVSQIILTVKKQDAASAPAVVREYK